MKRIGDLRKKIAELEEQNQRNFDFDQRNFDLDDEDYGDRLEGSKGYIILWRTEKEQRIKAEEFAAAMAARAKAGFEERDERIINLRMKVSNLETEKENILRLPSSAPSPLLLMNGE
eukprot:312917_1